MRLAHPEWLLLLPAFALAAWYWPTLGLRRPLRAIALLVVVLALSRPLIQGSSEAIDLWVLADRSVSAAGTAAKALPEWESILERTKRPGDELHVIDYGAEPVVRGRGDSSSIDNTETRTALAMRFALEQLAPRRVSRLLVLTDGYATEPLTEMVEPLTRRGIPLDYRLFFTPGGDDFRVAGLEAPSRVQSSEGFLLEAQVVGTRDGEVPFEILRDGQKIGEGKTTIRLGEARLRFSDRLRLPGAHRYGVRLLPEADVHPENDLAEAWVEVVAGSRVLLISAFDQDPLKATLTQSGFRVDQVTDGSKLHTGSLSGTKLVIFNNVPSHRVASEFLTALDFFVREQGGSVLMTGGQYSFGSGGYFASPLDPLLPVSMELRKEHRKLRVAMCVVMDRSGSMAVSVASGGGTVTKMDLADEGAARSIELLGDNDLVSVVAVDSAPHVMVPMQEIGPNRPEIINKTRRILSEGGGIFIYEGLKGGWEQLQKADAGQRHLILFADAADSEEPGDYKKLLKEMTDDGATVSVIGMGSTADVDAKLLEDIAKLGGGRALFNADPAQLPALFAQETVAIARSAFIKEPVTLKPTPGWLELAPRPLEWIAKVDGYNLSYLRPGATAASISGDEYSAPLVSYWQRGQGRTAAVSFPVAGPYSDTQRVWPKYNEFVNTLCRWLAPGEVPAGLGLRPRLHGTELAVDLFYGEDWADRVAKNGPRLVLGGNQPNTTRAVPWQRLAPGHFQAKLALKPGEKARGAVQVGDAVIPFGPVAASSSAEWQFRRESVNELRALSGLTGGRERLDLAQAWETPPQQHILELRPWLLIAFLVLLVSEALWTRLEV